MTWQPFLLVFMIHAVALVSPGPDFAVVTRASVTHGRRSGLLCALGVSCGIGLYVLVCILGLALVLLAVPGIKKILALAGALYLAWLALSCLKSQGKLPQRQTEEQGGRAFLTGLMTNLLNPKAMLYSCAVLSQALSPGLCGFAAALLWLLLLAESFAWFGLVALLFSSEIIIAWLESRLVWFDRAVGLILLLMSLGLGRGVLLK